MADYTSILLLGVTLMFIFLTLHKEHPFMAGILYILTGVGSLVILSTNNLYGLLIIAVGFIRIFTAPMREK